MGPAASIPTGVGVACLLWDPLLPWELGGCAGQLHLSPPYFTGGSWYSMGGRTGPLVHVLLDAACPSLQDGGRLSAALYRTHAYTMHKWVSKGLACMLSSFKPMFSSVLATD